MKSSPSSLLSSPMHNGPQFVVGIVMDCNPDAKTCDVKLDGAQTILGVPIMNSYGAAFGDDLNWVQDLRGAMVALIYLGSQYHVLGTLGHQLAKKVSGASVPASEPGVGGDDANTYQRGSFRDFSSGRPSDFLPGDKVLRAKGQAELGLFQGGIARLKASPLAQFMLCKFKDLGRLVVRNLQVFTDFGEIQVGHTDQGRVGLHLKGGASFSDESHPGTAKWTVQAWLGDYPDNPEARLFLRVNNPGNSEFVTLQFDTKGDMTIETSKCDNVKVGKDRTHDIVNDETITVGQDSSRHVGGDRTENVGGTMNITVVGECNIKASVINLN